MHSASDIKDFYSASNHIVEVKLCCDFSFKFIVVREGNDGKMTDKRLILLVYKQVG